jgi:hypothetical protein
LVTVHTHGRVVLALSECLVVEANDHAGKVVGRKAGEGIVDKLLGCFLRIVDMAD